MFNIPKMLQNALFVTQEFFLIFNNEKNACVINGAFRKTSGIAY
jgi:hypothetical protein